MTRLAPLLITFVVAGCGTAGTPIATTPESSMLVNIQSIVAEQLGLGIAEVHPEMTFSAVGADDLDLVEITMEVEDRFGITISDDALVNAAGARDATSLCDHLTVRMFATVAEMAPKQTQERPQPATDDGSLRESQVGAFGDLSQLPNPNGLVLVFVPNFEELTEIQEQHLGRKLDAVEIESLRQKAAVIALPHDMAEKLKQQKSERDGFRKQK